MLNTPFSPWPSYSDEEVAAVAEVLRSNRVNYWTGELARRFESAFARYVGTRHAVAVANGTVALDLALKALKVGRGDEVVVPPRTFIATASSVITAGATPVFADIDRNSQNLTAASIEAVITDRTKAIICVHLAGMPCDMEAIMSLARRKRLRVIEDCAQAHGALIDGRSVGSFGDIGAWSFCQDKIMTTGGEGGMVTTNDDDLWAWMWSYKDHGKSWDAVYKREHPPGPRLVHDTIGTNWRMMEIQAALGLIQLERLDGWRERRTKYAKMITDTLAKHANVRVPLVPSRITHAYYRQYAFVEEARLAEGWTRDRIIDEITKFGVPCFHGSHSEVYLEKAFDHTNGRPTQRLPTAKELGETSIAFLVHPTLSEDEVDLTCQAIDKVLLGAVS